MTDAKYGSDLCPVGIPMKKNGKDFVRVWFYRDTKGEIIRCSVRYEDDEGKIVVPFVKRGKFWKYGSPEPTPLLGLDEIAARPDDIVYIVEGEKAAEALQSIGLLATTSQGGSSRPQCADWSPLSGREIIIWRDNDYPGEKYQGRVLRQLQQLKEPPRIGTIKVEDLHLPETGDAFDWCERNRDAVAEDVMALPCEVPVLPQPEGTESNLVELIKPLPEILFDPDYEPPLRPQLFTRDEKACFVRGKAGAIIGQGGVGKTSIVMDLGIAISIGGTWLGTFKITAPERVAIILGEEDFAEIGSRAYRKIRNLGICNSPEDCRLQMIRDNFYCAGLSGKDVALLQTESRPKKEYSITKFAKELYSHLQAQGEWAAIIFDPLVRFGGPDVELDPFIATRFVEVIERFTTLPGGPAVIVASHVAKSKDSKTPRGSGALFDGFRWIASLTEDAKGVEFEVVKSNYSARGEPIRLMRTENGELVAVDRQDCQKRKPLSERILEFLSAGGPATVNKIRTTLKRNDKHVEKALDDLIDKGQVKKIEGKLSKYEFLEPMPSDEGANRK